MRQGFNVSLENYCSLNSDGQYSDELNENKKNIESTLDDLLLSDGKIDAEKLIEEWFPQGDYHVFISHSHKDLHLAEMLANWLHENFGIKSFIDSHVWGYADDLLERLNKDYAKINDYTYNYGPVMSHAAHVYIMLSTALTEVINKSDGLFFINTKNALCGVNFSDYDNSRTSSPWIMHELKVSSIIAENRRAQSVIGTEAYKSESASAEFSYKVSTKHLKSLTENDLLKWLKDCEIPPNRKTKPWFRKNYEKGYSALEKIDVRSTRSNLSSGQLKSALTEVDNR
ncbi:hypothetical protein [Oceanisphaera sp. W20_SRM_FM3]|uniref:hypothetical protein n=1 Tax=Oceanisphaera sp. W20_SRM_FM3 TaxID=3240267 RepID=UPI003F9BC0FD